MAEAAVARWRQLCVRFYTSSEENCALEALIGAFEALAPHNDALVIDVAGDDPKQSFVSAAAEQGVHLEILDDELWYQLNQAKNEARSQAHTIMAAQRADRLRSAVESLTEPALEANVSNAVGLLQALVQDYGGNIEAVPFFSSLALAFRTQMDETHVCSLVVHEAVLSEPGEAFTQRTLSFMNAVCHISRDRSPEEPAMLVMELREDLSDVSLQRMLRCIPSSAQQKDSHVTINYRVAIQPGTARTNMYGEQDGSICPYWVRRACGMCPIL